MAAALGFAVTLIRWPPPLNMHGCQQGGAVGAA